MVFALITNVIAQKPYCYFTAAYSTYFEYVIDYKLIPYGNIHQILSC